MNEYVIYCYTNTLNGKQYIGQTKNFQRRCNQHLSDSNHNSDDNRYNQPIHQAIRKYGIENFTIEIIDTTNTPEELDELEQYYIKLYNTLSPNGYNLTAGGNANHRKGKSSKLSQEEILLLINDLQNSNLTTNELSAKYNISIKYISDINRGKRLVQENIIYPIRKNPYGDCEDYEEIIDLLANSKLSMADISRKMNVSKIKVSEINNGKTKKARELYKGNFPIRDNSKYLNNKYKN